MSITKKAVWVWLGIAVFILSTLYAVFRNFHVVPLMDQWDTLDIYIKHLSGTLTLRDFWALHNEHRILIPRFLILADYGIEGGAGYLLVALTLILQAVHALLLGRAFSKAPGTEHGERLLFLCLALLACFWLKQRENFVWSFQVAWMMNGLAASVAAYCAAGMHSRMTDGQIWRRFLLLALCCAVASYTLANGIFIGGILFLLFLKARLRSIFLVTWLLFGAGLAASYLTGYHSTVHSVQHGTVPAQPWIYLLGYLGGPVLLKSPATFLGIFAGIAVLVGFLLLCLRFFREESPSFYTRFCFGAGGYVFIGALLTTMGRHVFGIMQAGSSRYTTPAVLLWFLVLSGNYAAARASGRKILGGVVGLMFLYILLTQAVLVGKMKATRVGLDEASLALVAEVDDTVALHRVYPNEEKLWERNTYMRDHRLFHFREPWTLTLGRPLPAGPLDSGTIPLEGVIEERRPVDSRVLPGSYLRMRVPSSGRDGLITFSRRDTIVGFARNAGRPCSNCYSGYVRGSTDSLEARLVPYGKWDEPGRKVLVR